MSMSADSTAPMGVSREIDDATTRAAVAAMQRLASRSRNGTTAMTDNHSNVTHAEPWSNSEPAAPPGAARLLGLNNYTNQATLDFHRALNLMMDGDGDVAHRNPRAINHMRRSTQNEGHGANHPPVPGNAASGDRRALRAHVSTVMDNPSSPYAQEVTELFNSGRIKHFRMCAMRYVVVFIFHLIFLQSHYWNARPPPEATTDPLVFGQEVGFWRNYLRGIRFLNFTAAWGPLAPLPCVIAVVDVALALLEYMLCIMFGIAGEVECRVVHPPASLTSNTTTSTTANVNAATAAAAAAASASSVRGHAEHTHDEKNLEEAMTTIRVRDRYTDHSRARAQPYETLSATLHREEAHNRGSHEPRWGGATMPESGSSGGGGGDVCAVEVVNERHGAANAHLAARARAGRSAAGVWHRLGEEESDVAGGYAETAHVRGADGTPRAAALGSESEHGNVNDGGRMGSSGSAAGDVKSMSTQREGGEAQSGEVYISVPGRDMYPGGAGRQNMRWRDYVYAVYAALFVGWQARMFVLRPGEDDYVDAHNGDNHLDSVAITRMMLESGHT